MNAPRWLVISNERVIARDEWFSTHRWISAKPGEEETREAKIKKEMDSRWLLLAFLFRSIAFYTVSFVGTRGENKSERKRRRKWGNDYSLDHGENCYQGSLYKPTKFRLNHRARIHGIRLLMDAAACKTIRCIANERKKRTNIGQRRASFCFESLPRERFFFLDTI